MLTCRRSALGACAVVVLGAPAVLVATARHPAAAAISPVAPIRAVPPTTSERPPAESTPETAPTTSATSVAPRSVVGVLTPAGSSSHDCTASVLASPGADLLLTAAHCVAGTGAGTVFTPGYADGAAPYGSWTVTAAVAPAGWIDDQDPADDVAVLVVAPQSEATGPPLQVGEIVGGADAGAAPAAGQPTTITGYDAGVGGSPVVCTATTYLRSGFPAFDCPGFEGGTSGGPWLTTDAATGRSTVHGVIGGLDQGGCTAGTSYSAPVSVAELDALIAAASGGQSEVLPEPGPDGC